MQSGIRGSVSVRVWFSDRENGPKPAGKLDCSFQNSCGSGFSPQAGTEKEAYDHNGAILHEPKFIKPVSEKTVSK